MSRLRGSERICAAYFAYTAGVAAVRGLPLRVRMEVWIADAAVLAALWLLSRPRAERRPALAVLRDWFPLALLLLAYRQMGWMALPHENRNFENFWIGFDRLILCRFGLKHAIEFFGPFLPNALELCYLLVYVMPVAAVAVFYAAGARRRLDRAYTILLSATLGAYALYPYFPSEPPRIVFPNSDLPPMSSLRAFNLRILGA